MIRERLVDGHPVWYSSTGDSMWPLVQSGDFCTFHPIQAVTASDSEFSIQKGPSDIGVGDVVFCQVHPTQQYYAHIVLGFRGSIDQPEYRIGNLEGYVNGTCYRENIFGILVNVQQPFLFNKTYHSRPHPKAIYEKVSRLIERDRWSYEAHNLCAPSE